MCLAWLLNKHPHVIPIACTRRTKYLIENAHATEFQFSDEKIKQLDTLFANENIAAERYLDAGWGGIER